MPATTSNVGPSEVSLIVTAHCESDSLLACLASVARLNPAPREVIVVVDGGCERVAAAAAKHGFQTHFPAEPGVAFARNAGARKASGEILAFADSDIVLLPDFVERAARALSENPGVSAAFGSYDANPEASGVVSRYRNLLHHFTHQRGSREAQTFWAACGVIRREAFFDVGGFDESFRRPSVEDIDLGYRLRSAGHRMILSPDWQVRHLKRWRLRDLIMTDIFHRAAPWTRLLLRERRFDDDLNIDLVSRWSAALLFAALAALLAAWWFPPALWLTGACFGAVILLNRRFYSFLAATKGWRLAASAIPLHFFYFACASAGFAIESVATIFRSPKPSSISNTRPMRIPLEPGALPGLPSAASSRRKESTLAS